MINQYKNLLIKLAAFVLVFWIFDYTIGHVLDYLQEKAFLKNPNNVAVKTNYLIEKADEDIIIIGASDASHHYVPQMIMDSTGMTVSNCGQDGCFFVFQNCAINLMLERYSPKVLIWQLNADYLSDNFNQQMEYQSINRLYKYYDDCNCGKIINGKSRFQPIFMLSGLYRHNSSIFKYIHSIVISHKFDNGYVPISDDGINYPILEKKVINQSINNDKVKLFENTVMNLQRHGVNVVFTTAPKYSKSNIGSTVQYKTLTKIASKYKIPYIESEMLDYNFMDSTLFHDNDHMNEKGTELYMHFFIPAFKDALNMYSKQ